MTMRAAAETTAKMMGQEGVHLTINNVLRWWIAEDGGWGERKRWCGDCGDGRTTPTTKAVASSKHANDICAVVGSLSSAVLSDRGGGRMLAIVQNPGEGGGGMRRQPPVPRYCVPNNAVHYNWTYFEKGGAEEQRELLVRWAQRMNHTPMVHHLVARGRKNMCGGLVGGGG